MSRAKMTGLPMRQLLEAIGGCGLGSHGERLSARPPSPVVGFFAQVDNATTNWKANSSWLPKLFLSLPITNALPKAVRGRYRRLTARALGLSRILG